MKQGSIFDYHVFDWSEAEIETAEFLLELNHRVSLWSSVPYSWGCRRKRSAIQKSPSSQAVKAQASSPATPLSFPATESDEKTKPSKIKTSLKRKREYYLNMIEDMTKTKDSLNQEIENVKRHCDQLKDFNLKLKAKKKQLSTTSNGPKGECKSPNLVVINQTLQWNNHINEEGKNKEQHEQIQVPHFGLSQTCNGNSSIVQLPVASSSLGRNNNMGPLSIPDLNLSIEDPVHVDTPQPLDVPTTSYKDLSKVMAAQARQRRLHICRLKKRQSSYR